MKFRFSGTASLFELFPTSWDNLWTQIEDRLDESQGVEKISYSATGADDGKDLDEYEFQRLAKTSAPGVFIVHCAVQRKVLMVLSESKALDFCVFATDFRHFLEQMEHRARGASIRRVVFRNASEEEIEVNEENFNAVPPTATLVVHAEQPGIAVILQSDEDDQESHILRSIADWKDLLSHIQTLAAGKTVERILYRLRGQGQGAKGDAAELDEELFASLKSKPGLTVVVQVSTYSSIQFTVHFPGSARPRTFTSSSLGDLMEQVEQAADRPLEGLRYEVKGPHGQLIENDLDESNFSDVRELGDVVLRARFGGATPTCPRRRVLVQFPGELFPMNLKVADFADLTAQVDGVLSQRNSPE
eukprot:RCo005429